ncbi:MAG: hypothetical protein J7527_18435 [Chitinophagaceae bacterium]|nr:hypothetical protein [Chitinophagaceae bacterium]
MKTYKEVKKKYTDKEIAESLVFPSTASKKEREMMLGEFSKFRQQAASKQTQKEKTISSLLQLKFLIEDHIASDAFDESLHFGHFLKEYILRLEKKNKEFAAEIDVDPTELSQVINRHRKPTDKLIYRLDIHSNKNFPATMWFRMLEKERVYELTHNPGIIDKEKKHVKVRLKFSI